MVGAKSYQQSLLNRKVWSETLSFSEFEILLESEQICRKTADNKPVLYSQVQTLPYNKIPEQNALRQLYNNDMFVEFVRKVFNLPSLFRSADPAGACTVNVFKEGCYNAWHFDQSQFSTSIMLQAPEAGGEFQYTMPFRNWMSTQRRVGCPWHRAKFWRKKFDQVFLVVFFSGVWRIREGRARGCNLFRPCRESDWDRGRPGNSARQGQKVSIRARHPVPVSGLPIPPQGQQVSRL